MDAILQQQTLASRARSHHYSSNDSLRDARPPHAVGSSTVSAHHRIGHLPTLRTYTCRAGIKTNRHLSIESPSVGQNRTYFGSSPNSRIPQPFCGGHYNQAHVFPQKKDKSTTSPIVQHQSSTATPLRAPNAPQQAYSTRSASAPQRLEHSLYSNPISSSVSTMACTTQQLANAATKAVTELYDGPHITANGEQSHPRPSDQLSPFSFIERIQHTHHTIEEKELAAESDEKTPYPLSYLFPYLQELFCRASTVFPKGIFKSIQADRISLQPLRRPVIPNHSGFWIRRLPVVLR